MRRSTEGYLMRYFLPFVLGLAVAGSSLLGGCARAARDTTGFAQAGSASVAAPHEQTWQVVKTVLREQEYEIYTRDKRGTFVAYTPMKRRFFQPHRVKYTIQLTEASSNETHVDIETMNQVYGVTLLTYPGWHDRQTGDSSGADRILQAVQSKIAGAPVGVAAEQTVEAPPAEVAPTVEAVPADGGAEPMNELPGAATAVQDEPEDNDAAEEEQAPRWQFWRRW
jgi:hypothetical protein